ncbi:MAG TPA: PTS cellobiose transporter subunit IIC, partial [Leuconostoc lactis]|nr:PTS cellobiose transporter subunit IIC [Leuconostoc lactis]
MRYFLVNVAQRWEAKLWQTTAFQSIKTALHQSLPIIVIDIYLRLSVKLILSPNALFVKLFNLDAKPFKPLFDTILVLLPMADGAVVLIYVIALTYQYLTANHYQNTSLP